MKSPTACSRLGSKYTYFKIPRPIKRMLYAKNYMMYAITN